MKFNLKTFLNWILLIFWMGVIFFLSSQPDLKSGFETWLDFILRKIAHIAEYGILTFFAWRAISENGAKKGIKYLIAAAGFSILYAISDEYHQTFIAGRHGSPIDVLIDSAGIAVASISILRSKAGKSVSGR